MCVFFNVGYVLFSEFEFYVFGNYLESEGDGLFYYCYLGNGIIEDIWLEDGLIWNLLEFFFGGFMFCFFGDVIDYLFVGGVKGMLGDFIYDISGCYGNNEIFYILVNIINLLLGNELFILFKLGDLINEEI